MNAPPHRNQSKPPKSKPDQTRYPLNKSKNRKKTKMPSILEDPRNKTPAPQSSLQAAHLTPRKTITRTRHHPQDASQKTNTDTVTNITLYPVAHGAKSLPADLVRFLHGEFAAEIERGSTYPMEAPLGAEQFAEYWFGTFAVVAVLDGESESESEGEREGLVEGRDWERVCLGTFYIKPNYPGSWSLFTRILDGRMNE